jgi:DNA transposition AAA+ family ATPase
MNDKHYIETSVCRDMFDAIAYSRAMRRAAAVIGPPGIGKTVALRRHAETDKDAIYVRVSTAQSSGKAAFRLFADAFGIGQQGRETADGLWRGVEDYCESAVDWKTGEHLLIDEAQALDLNVLKEFVDLPSRVGFPVVICGNAELLKRTRVGRGDYEQIASRCAKRLILTAPLDEDLAAIAADFDVYGADSRAAAVNYGQNTSIRELVQLLEEACAFVGRGPIKLDALRRTAVSTKGGAHALKLLCPAA